MMSTMPLAVFLTSGRRRDTLLEHTNYSYKLARKPLNKSLRASLTICMPAQVGKLFQELPTQLVILFARQGKPKIRKPPRGFYLCAIPGNARASAKMFSFGPFAAIETPIQILPGHTHSGMPAQKIPIFARGCCCGG